MNGSREPKQAMRPLKKIERRGIEVVFGTVEFIDPLTRVVKVS